MAVGGNEVSLSTDGVSWTNHYLSAGVYLRRIAYGAGTWAAIWSMPNGPSTSLSTIALSSDGAGWTNQYSTTDSLNSICYGKDQWVAVGSWGGRLPHGLIVTSSNGTEWVERSAEGTALYDVAYGADTWVAAGVHSGYRYALTSSNGTTWNSSVFDFSSFFASSSIERVSFGGGVWVALGFFPASIYTATDGNHWVTRATNLTEHFNGAAYGNGHWIVVSSSGQILRAGPVVFLHSIQKLPTGEFRLSFSGQVGVTYRLQTSEDLQRWTNRMTIEATNETMRLGDAPAASLRNRYYRIVSP